MTTELLSIACGIASGFALGLIGGGGSILATPLLLYVVGIREPHIAIGTGAAALSVAALANFSGHAFVGNVRWRSALVFAATGVLGALAGSTLGQIVDGHRLILLFAGVMIVVAVLLLLQRYDQPASPNYGARSDTKVAGLALAAGMASGFFGIGGGFMIVPCLLYATRMPMIDAIGSSLLAVTAFNVATTVNYARSGLVDWPLALYFIVGGIVGGGSGMLLANRLSSYKNTLRRILGAVILAGAAYIIWRGIS